jgi:hypothetical protein
LKKKRIFLIPIRYWAATRLETESGPAVTSLLPHPRGPAEAKRPSQNRPAPASRAAQPARLLPRGVEKSQNRGHRLPGAAPSRTRPADPDPDPDGVRPWLPRTLSPHTCPEPTWMEIVGRLPTEGNENQILTDYLSIASPNPKFSWRLGSGCYCAPAHAFAPINRTLRRPPEHFSPLTLPFPNRATVAVPTRSLPRQTKPRRRLPEPLRNRRS